MSSPSSASPQQHDGAAGDASASASARSAASPSAAFSSASGRGKTLANARASEELEIAVNLALERFWYSDDQGGVLRLVEASRPRGAVPGLRAAAFVCVCAGAVSRLAAVLRREGGGTGAPPRRDVNTRGSENLRLRGNVV